MISEHKGSAAPSDPLRLAAPAAGERHSVRLSRVSRDVGLGSNTHDWVLYRYWNDLTRVTIQFPTGKPSLAELAAVRRCLSQYRHMAPATVRNTIGDSGELYLGVFPTSEARSIVETARGEGLEVVTDRGEGELTSILGTGEIILAIDKYDALYIFESTKDAEALEAIDVREDAFEFCDARGQRYSPRFRQSPKPLRPGVANAGASRLVAEGDLDPRLPHLFLERAAYVKHTSIWNITSIEAVRDELPTSL